MKKLLVTCLVFCLATTMTTQPSLSEETVPKPIAKVFAQAKALILQYYPQAEIKESGGRLECRYKTRKFMIHYPLKTGEWQEARETEGPNRGGIMCTIGYKKGQWMGAAMVPQTFEYHYFASSLHCPYNKKLDSHIESHLTYPDNTSAEFLTRYANLMKGFAQED